jgi:signal transduction histidine kinase
VSGSREERGARSGAPDVPKLPDRFFAAERRAAWVRLAFAIAGTLYLAVRFADAKAAPALAVPLLAAIWPYTALVLLGEPYRRLSRFQYGYLTTALDALLSTAWIAATGGWDSPWWPLYLAMIVATALRFDNRETVIATLAYAALYLAMLGTTGALGEADPVALSLRLLFIFAVAALAGPLAQQAVEQARQRASFEEAARRAREVENLKSQFFANVSHELRTPLALILGPASELAAADNLTPAQRDQVRLVLDNSRSLLRRVGELLEVARLEAGRLELRYSEVDLGDLVRKTAGSFDGLAQERGGTYEVVAPERLPAQVDPDRVARVIVNLIANAFKFAPGPSRIRVELRTDDDRAVIEVADSGPGVPRKLRDAVFERFRQLGEGADHRHGGTGLGLAIARELVELHSGSIGVDDAPEGGARFWVVLPRSAPEGARIVEAPAPAAAAQDMVAAVPAGRPGPAP